MPEHQADLESEKIHQDRDCASAVLAYVWAKRGR